MSCNKIVADVVNSCVRPVRGVEPLAYWTYRKDVSFSITDNTVTAIITPALGSIQSNKFGLNAGHDYVPYENTPDGYKHKFSGVLQKSTADLDEMDDIVIFVKSNSGLWLGYGMQQGLWKTSQAKMANDNLGTVAVEFTSREGMEEAYQEYVITADLDAIPKTTVYDVLVGMYLPDGTSMELGMVVDTAKTGSILLPDGERVNTVSGVATRSYTGTGGKIYFCFDKTTTSLNIGTDVRGILKSANDTDFSFSDALYLSEIDLPNAPRVLADGCLGLIAFSAPKSIYTAVYNCNFTADMIESMLHNFVVFGQADGICDVSLGTNAVYSTWSAQAQADYATLTARGWTITKNE